MSEEAYSDIRMEEVEPFHYIKYTVVSTEPEEDAISHVRAWANKIGIENPQIIGWDFPVLSQEQINVFNMHGYTAALMLDANVEVTDINTEMKYQEKQK